MMYPRSNGDALLFIQVPKDLYFLFSAYDKQDIVDVDLRIVCTFCSRPAKAIV